MSYWSEGASIVLSLLGRIANTRQANQTNIRLTRETNAANRKMVELQNQAAAAESQKAYERSKASNQVALMTAAGMSRAGAINVLNGGGSYTPAPVNTSQDTAPQVQPIDFSGLSNLAQIIMQEKQLNLNADINADAIDYKKDKEYLKSIYDKINNRSDWFNSTTHYIPTIDDVYYVLNDSERKAMTNPLVREQVQQYLDGAINTRRSNSDLYYSFMSNENNLRLQELERELREAVQKNAIGATKAEYAAREAKALLEEFNSDSAYDSISNMPKNIRQKYFETRALLEWLSHASDVSAEKFIAKARTLLGI